jgi:hypothetical protein
LLIISIIYIAIVVYLSTQSENQNNQTNSSTTTSNLNQIDTSVISIPEEPDISNVHYSIVSAQYKNPVRCVLSVRLNKKIPQSQLAMIANKIRQESDCVSDIIYIAFLLPEIKLGSGAWANVDFTPNIKIKFLGPSLEKEQEFKAKIIGENIEVIGRWVDNTLDTKGEGVLERMRYNSKGVLILEIYTIEEPYKESPLPRILKKMVKNGKTIYIDIESDVYGEYFIINKNGDLECYDNQGYIQTNKKI